MNDYKLTLDIDPEDNYSKAKKDTLTAYDSIQKLTPQEKEKLIKELFGAAAVEEFYRIVNQGLRR